MLPLTTINRCVVVFLLAIGVIGTACNKKTDAQPPQKAHVAAPQNDYDEDGYPIDRNRHPGVGTTHLRGDGLEELNIPLREEPGVGGGIFSEVPELDPIDPDRPVGIGSTRLRNDGAEELIIPLRERFFEDDPVTPREVKP
jgi:hypothetical protein